MKVALTLLLIAIAGAAVIFISLDLFGKMSPETLNKVRDKAAEITQPLSSIELTNFTPSFTPFGTPSGFLSTLLPSRPVKAQLTYCAPKATDRIVYVREYSDFKPPRGAPVFYAPFPSTLCMLGEENGERVRVIWEARPGACDSLLQNLGATTAARRTWGEASQVAIGTPTR